MSRPPRLRRFLDGRSGDDGMVSAFTAIVFVTLLGFTGLVVDGGLALTARVQALGQAEDAARAGAQALDLDTLRFDHAVRLNPAQAQQAALDYLHGTGATGEASANQTDVTVTVTVHTPTHLLMLFGVTSLTEHGTATAHAATGTNSP
ncbi:TadE/TadG family type IV pilus assembly protein [Streptacidiphilus sp. MAP5-3]|uniref:TadE/TadG family type IV pilus assembly protein n=1 Tax=unclassified Streptacidiphilus TaxID=2643834 RepID=UPI00351321EF